MLLASSLVISNITVHSAISQVPISGTFLLTVTSITSPLIFTSFNLCETLPDPSNKNGDFDRISVLIFCLYGAFSGVLRLFCLISNI